MGIQAGEERRLRRVARTGRPVFYGPFARYADWTAGRRDGKGNIFEPALERRQGTAAGRVVPPHVAALGYRFNEYAHSIRHALKSLAESKVAERRACADEVRRLERNLTEVRTTLANIPTTAPLELLQRRNAVEQDKSVELVAARNQREWDARRGTHAADESRLESQARAKRARMAVLDGEIAALESVGDSAVRRRQAHARRRAHSYRKQLFRKHEDRAVLEQVLDFSGPANPEPNDLFGIAGLDGDDGPNLVPVRD
ncbi:hypothetical protein [Nocardia sp. NPDC057227]|uniref:hypothetical protein n=1 Tax=Nocardia sp. NPDC057227 TaxID=3346056 RepID=UPI0036298D68